MDAGVGHIWTIINQQPGVTGTGQASNIPLIHYSITLLNKQYMPDMGTKFVWLIYSIPVKLSLLQIAVFQNL